MIKSCGKAPSNSVDERELRDVLGCFATGVAVATTCDHDGEPVGLTISSFNSVSLNPPLILWSLARDARSHAAFCAASAFAINILSNEQKDVCMRFAKSSIDKFGGVAWHSGIRGIPVITDALATLECRHYRQYEGGDHTIFIGEVVHVDASEKAPLIYHRGALTGLATGLLPAAEVCNG
ncbi:MAG: flavin reductase family protein [Hyphomicrobiaceae bacterium]